MVEQQVSGAMGRGLVRMASPAMLDAADAEAAKARQEAALNAQRLSEQTVSDLAAYVRRQFETMKNHRESGAGWNGRLLNALQMFNGEYSASKLAEIQKYGGSTTYARIVAVKCRGASALLRDIYLSAQRPWGLKPTPTPTLPDDIKQAMDSLIRAESAIATMGGMEPTEEEAAKRRIDLTAAAEQAARKRAADEAEKARKKLDDLLVEGGFYTALAEFLVDLPLFPFAVIKGPVVRIAPRVKWVNRRAVIEDVPRMYWERVSPFDFWFSGGVADIANADTTERLRLTRAELNGLLGLPGYDEDAIRQVLRDYGESGYVEITDSTDSNRADSESRENPMMNESGIIDCLEFHGSIQGRLLKQHGVKGIKDEDRDYTAQVWLVGRHVIKVQLSPSPRKRSPYYVTSFEKVPGTVVGNALPDILSDIQDVCNATLRSLVNNLAIASGPQVVIDEDSLVEGTDTKLYPWKQWKINTAGNITGRQSKAVEFFHPNMHAQELLGVYEKFTQIADEISAIPRYITGSERMGGAGRTASGLAMLMGNASKILQTVAANIDRDVFEPLLQALYDILMLTSPPEGEPGALRGDESIEVRGVQAAIQRETERQRQIEFLQATANPFDMKIMGEDGRAKVLRAVSNTLGMEGIDIVPPDDVMAQRIKQEQAAAMVAGLGVSSAAGAGLPGAIPPGADESGMPQAPGATAPGGSPAKPSPAGPAVPPANVMQ